MSNPIWLDGEFILKLTSHSVKWILRKCGDLENYMFDERDFENILSKAGFPGGFVAPNYDSRFIVAHVSMCKVLPVELSHMILTFIPGTWHEEKSRFHVDKECRYCWRVFKSFSWPTHLKSNVHQARLRKLAIPAYMKGKLPLSKDIGWVNTWLRSALIFKHIRSYRFGAKRPSEEASSRQRKKQSTIDLNDKWNKSWCIWSHARWLAAHVPRSNERNGLGRAFCNRYTHSHSASTTRHIDHPTAASPLRVFAACMFPAFHSKIWLRTKSCYPTLVFSNHILQDPDVTLVQGTHAGHTQAAQWADSRSV